MRKLAAIWLAIAIGVAGCGETRDTGSANGTRPTQLSATEFTQQANEICAETIGRLRQLTAAHSMGEVLTQAISYEGRMIAELRKLVPPATSRARFALLIETLAHRRTARHGLLVATRRHAPDLHPAEKAMNDQTARAYRLAEQLRLGKCPSP